MEFKFDHQVPHQIAAINAVVNIFKGQTRAGSAFETTRGEVGSITFGEKGIGNRLELDADQLLTNIKEVQKANDLHVSSELIARISHHRESASLGIDLNLSIEMETGTGKTYTYIRTIYELHRVYGFCKFVIVVPSVAIREGVLKNLEITAKDMHAQYGVPANYAVWDSKNRDGLGNFARSNSLEILVINIDSFASDTNIINTMGERGVKPIEFLQATRPIVIVDEPQNMETEIRHQAIDNLHPLCTLRYSATHKNPYNLISRLTAVDAYNGGLVKQIQVDGITTEQNYNAAFVALKEIRRGSKHKAKLSFFANGKTGGVLKIDALIGVGDDLFEKSKERKIYRDGFILEEINSEAGYIKFTNGLMLRVGESSGGLTDDIQKFQIERTVKWHFERAQKLRPMGIKVLSLFFIDKVANYRATEGEKAKFEVWFEEAFEKFSKQNPGLIPHAAQEVHKGYFSQDKKGVLKDTKGTTKDDEDAYSLIMKNKEMLLSLDNPVQFIFSHSALREGWDNPNVFQICTLNESASDIKKRQEIGRGLRLAVNSKTGERITDAKINLLTVIANESYETFTQALQTEIEEETGIRFQTDRIADANREKVVMKYTKDELTRENYPLLFELWDKVSFHTRYAVEYDEAVLVNKTVGFLKDTHYYCTIKPPQIHSNTANIKMNEFGVSAKSKQSTMKLAKLNTSVMPDVFGFIQSHIKLSRGSILEVLKGCGRADELMLNPQKFLEHMVAAFKRARNEILYEGGVKYERGAKWDWNYTQQLFTDELGEILQDKALKVRQGYEDKTLFNHYCIDSNLENDFARECEEREEVKFFFKIPRGFKIPTPIGHYSPDWAVVVERDKKLYFVAETKSTLDAQKLRGEEKYKIRFGTEFFKSLDTEVKYKPASEFSDLI